MPPPFPLSLAFIIGERHASSKLRVFLGTLREQRRKAENENGRD